MKIVLSALLLLLVFSCNKRPKAENKIQRDSLGILFYGVDSNSVLSVNQKLKLLKKAESFVDNSSDSLIPTRGRIAKLYYKLRELDDAEVHAKKLIEEGFNRSDTLAIAYSYNLLGNIQIDLSNNDSAYYYLSKAEKLFGKLNDTTYIGKNYIDKAFAQLYENDYSGCEISAIQALSHFQKHPDARKEYDALNLIAISSNELKNYDNAIVYHNKALKVVEGQEKFLKYHLAPNTLNNLGVVYQYLDNHPEAIKHFNSALSEKGLLEDSPNLYAILIDNLAYSKFKLGDYTNLPDLYFRSLAIREKNEMHSGIIVNKIHLSEFYAAIKDTVKAQDYASQALALAKKTKVSGDIMASLKQLSAVVSQSNSVEYTKEYIHISDSINEAQRIAKNKFGRIQFETDQIQSEAEKLAEQNRTLVYFFVGTFLIGVLLFVIRYQRSKNRELLLKQAQQKANEDIYNLIITQQSKLEEGRIKEKKRIAQEIHDGVLGRLFGARLNLDSLNRSSDENVISQRGMYLTELKLIEQDLREISHDLNREKYVLINNFVAILNDLLENQKASFQSELRIEIDENISWDQIDNATKINVYRIIQESLQNINKYANALTIRISIKQVDKNLMITISDDGVGFEISSRKKGIGLQNMSSRAADLGGTLDIKSKKGSGTIITLMVPARFAVLEENI